MNDQPISEDRHAMIADGPERALEPDEAADVALLADLLADPATWAEPRAGLEDEVVHSVAAAPAAPAVSARERRPARPRRVWIAAVAAAAVIVLGVGLVVVRGNTNNQFDSQLTATALAPAANGSAGITHNAAGFRIRLDTHGLPALGAGEYYQAWLKNAAGVGVPIGTFSSSDARVTLWSGVSPAAFPTITVTIELTDNNQASSGRVVLHGTVTAH